MDFPFLEPATALAVSTTVSTITLGLSPNFESAFDVVFGVFNGPSDGRRTVGSNPTHSATLAGRKQPLWLDHLKIPLSARFLVWENSRGLVKHPRKVLENGIFSRSFVCGQSGFFGRLFALHTNRTANSSSMRLALTLRLLRNKMAHLRPQLHLP
jgi:hypothetical protein